MGLRMFVEPDVNEAKTAIKTDPSAPARSTIRRQRTVRYTPHVRDRPSSRAHPDATSRELHQRRLLREFMRQRGHEREHDAEQEAVRAEAERAEASRQQRLNSGRALLRDALSYERPSQRMRMLRDHDDLPNLIPITDTDGTSYSEVARRSVHNESLRAGTDGQTMSPPPRYMPTPPYSFEDSSSRFSPSSLTPSDSADFSSRFPPPDGPIRESTENSRSRAARRGTHQMMLDEITRNRREVERTREEVRRTREVANRAWREMDSSMYDPLDELPPLRRMGRRPRSPAAAEGQLPPPRNPSHVDGLGDRRRSFSPEDEAWDILLTTITPDERVPSVHSSFTSSAASASASVAPNPESSNSYGSLATLPSSGILTAEPDPNLCDLTDSEDSLTEDESVPTNLHPRSGRDANQSTDRAGPTFRHPLFSRRYDLRALEQLRESEAALEALDSLERRNAALSERMNDFDMTYLDRYRRERLRHHRATETGIERTGGVRPARERL